MARRHGDYELCEHQAACCADREFAQVIQEQTEENESVNSDSLERT